MMEENYETIEKSEATIKLSTLSSLIEEVRQRTRSISSLKEFISIEYKNNIKSKGFYKECIDNIYKNIDLSDDEFARLCMYNCNNYLSYATGKKYNSTVYNNAYRKEFYKQLNVDIPKDMMQEFEENLKNNHNNKKTFIIECIKDYNQKCKKKK